MTQNFDTDTASTVFVAVAYHVARSHRFTNETDLVEAIKSHCARLRIAYYTAAIWAALDYIERTRGSLVVPRGGAPLTSPSDNEPVSRDEAARIIARIRQQLARRGRSC